MTRVNIPIFLSSDNNYAPFVATTIASICDNTESFCEFYILDGGITEKNQNKISELKNKFSNFSIEFIKIDIEKYFDKYPNSLHYSKTMYARFLIPYLKPNLNKVLYSDVDVIVLGDISDMYNENIEGYTIGAVAESFLGETLKNKYLNELNISPLHMPFASGNLIIDCDSWRNKNITDKLFAIDYNKQNDFPYVDQTLMNICFDNSYKQLDKRYCYTIQHDVCMPDKEVIICHFNGPIKPWQINESTKTNLMPYLEKFWYYAKMTNFYEELNSKTLDKKQQNELLLQLRVFRMQAKRNYER